jgi:hypothetical protein
MAQAQARSLAWLFLTQIALIATLKPPKEC